MAIHPCPVVGMIGLIDDWKSAPSVHITAEGLSLFVIGQPAGEGWLGASLCASIIAGREGGAPPPVELETEQRHGQFVRNLISQGAVEAVHDIGDGGILLGYTKCLWAVSLAHILMPQQDLRATAARLAKTKADISLPPEMQINFWQKRNNRALM